MKTDQKPGVVDGTVYGLFPEGSRMLYEECISGLAEERKVNLSSTLDSKVTDIAEQVWKKIHTAEVVMADITGYDLQVMCEIGMARGLKDAKKIVLLCSEATFEAQETRLPLDLRGLTIQLYDEDNFLQIRQDLSAILNDSLRNRAPVEPIKDYNVRQLVKKAVKNTHISDYVVAEVLFKQADEQLPDHWNIHMQWGVMLREKGDFPEAREYLRKAEQEAEFDEHKAEVYIEQAILEFRDKEASKAEGLFERAKSTDKKNRRLYIVWADVMDQLGMPERAVGRIADLMDAVGKDEETAILTRYYSNKLNNPHFTTSLEEFKKQQQMAGARTAHQEPRSAPPPKAKTTRPQVGIKPIPNKITWPQFKREFRGTVVEGIVKNVHSGLGVFVYLGNFKGLLHKKHLTRGFKSLYSKGDKLNVKILRCYTRREDGVDAIDLILA